MASVDFAEVTALQEQERWDEVAEILSVAARGVEAGGADFLLLCTTTFHRTSQRLLLLLSYMDGVRPNPHDNVERPPHSLLDPLDMRWRYCVGGRGTR
jgi:hypothetical protein